jgi:hypothetical protein
MIIQDARCKLPPQKRVVKKHGGACLLSLSVVCRCTSGFLLCSAVYGGDQGWVLCIVQGRLPDQYYHVHQRVSLKPEIEDL